MNRREFLKTWIAIGGVCSLPLDQLQAATNALVDTAWEAAGSNAITFYVNNWGALSDRPGLEGFDFTQSRRDLFRLGVTPASSPDLVAFVESNSHLDDVAWQTHSDFTADYWRDHDDEECPWETWREWAMSGQCDELVAAIDDWLDDLPDDNDYASADICGLSCRGDVVFFFQERPEIANLIGVGVPDPERGWTPDYCVWLKDSVEDANLRAAQHGLPIRFEAWEE